MPLEKINKAYLTFFAKLLIANGILTMLTDGETTIANQTSGTDSLSSASVPDPETIFSTNSSNGETLGTVITMDYDITSSTNASDNQSIVTTEVYSTSSTSQTLNQRENDSIIDFPDNSSSVRIMGPTPSNELQDVSTPQGSDTQASSAATTTSMSYNVVTSGFKVSSTQELSTPLHTSVAGARSNLGLVLTTWVLIFILILVLICVLAFYLRRKRRRYSFDLFHKTAEDADIPLSSPVFPGTLDVIPDKEENNYVKMNEDTVNNERSPVVNEKQINCETETNHSPANLGQENTDNLDDWKPPGSTFTDIDLMDCVTVQ
ncbi:uncharacterized protein LOC144491796 [Mustelus asterias]